MEINIDWQPQERQLVLLNACGLGFPFEEDREIRPSGSVGEPFHSALADVFGYGGSAGGGKTDTLINIANVAAFRFPKINIGYFRREFPQLEGLGGAIQRSKELLKGICHWNNQTHRWTYPTESLLQFCHCQNPDDVYNYQSQQFDILLIDEATQFTEEMIDYLITRNRKTINDPLFKPFTVLATNPGNVGHASYKTRMCPNDPNKHEKPMQFVYPTGITRTHMFIPSKLDDNKILTDRDPTYADRISTSELNRKMLLEGDWDVFQGQAFSELTMEKHLINPYEDEARSYFGAYDHGFNHPFSFGVFSVDSEGNVELIRHVKDRLKRVDEIAHLMEMAFDLKKLAYIVAGKDCWSKQRDGSPSVQEQFYELGISLNQAKMDRVQGAQQVRMFLAWKLIEKTDTGWVDGIPRFRIFKPYSSVYNTLAQMIFDPNKPEDVLKVDADENGHGGDDDYDMVRYGLMSRPRPYQKTAQRPKPNTKEEMLEWIEKVGQLKREEL